MRMTPSPHREPDRAKSQESASHENGDDALFYFADKTAGFVSALGLGYLLIHALPAAVWIAIVCLVVGLGAKVLFRAL